LAVDAGDTHIAGGVGIGGVGLRERGVDDAGAGIYGVDAPGGAGGDAVDGARGDAARAVGSNTVEVGIDCTERGAVAGGSKGPGWPGSHFSDNGPTLPYCYIRYGGPELSGSVAQSARQTRLSTALFAVKRLETTA
jgi:hypothetical protein